MKQTEKYILKKYKTRQLLHQWRDQYNAQQCRMDKDGKLKKDHRRCLRQSHIKLAEYLIELLYLSLEKYQSHTPLVQGEALPCIRTNNRQLSAQLGVCEKTILNLRKRLITAQVIEEEIWHGSNSGYELRLNSGLLWLSRPGQNQNEIAFFAAQSEKFTPYSNQLQRQDTKELIQLSGEDFQLGIENQPFRAAAPVKKPVPAVEKGPQAVEKPQMCSGLGTKPATKTGYTTSIGENLDTSPPIAAHPPQNLTEALAGLPEQLQTAIRRHVNIIWACVLTHLSDNWDFLSDSQVARGKAALAEYLAPAQPDRYAAGAAEICGRIVLVAKWIERGRKQGQNRWVPLPAQYFDHRNRQNGFVLTKSWYKAHKAAQKDIQDRVLLTKALKRYLRSLVPGATESPAETYRQLSQKLGKRDKQLMQLFHEKIQEHESQSASAAA